MEKPPRSIHRGALMNAAPPPHLIDDAMQRMVGEVKAFARREPVKAAAACFGLGLLVHLLPARVLAGTLVTTAAALAPPALLFLGIVKSLELFCQKPKT